VVTEELSKDNILHYHLYAETDVCEKTVRNYVTEALGIPKLKRGQSNGYYCLKYDAYTNPNPRYVLKDGKVLSKKGYTEEELVDMTKQGAEEFKATPERVIVAAAEGRGKKTDGNLVEMYLDYIDQVLPKDVNQMRTTYTIEMLRSGTIRYFRTKSGGLMPQASTYKRFLVSAWLEWNELIKRSQSCAEIEIEKYGY